MVIDSDDAILTVRHSLRGETKRTLTWNRDDMEELVVDLDTLDYTLTVRTQTDPITGAVSNYTGTYPNQSFSGVLYLGLHIDCHDCGQYGYGLRIAAVTCESGKGQLVVDLDNELLSSDDGTQAYEIENRYISGETVYYQFSQRPTYVDRRIKLPLIPLDPYDPEGTLKRIKSLIVFS
jgi:hypothetical protein